MILIYVACETPRIVYTIRFVVGRLLGMNFRITSSDSEYLQYYGPKILYTPDPHLPGGIFVQSNGFLNEQGIREFMPGFAVKNQLPVVFPSSNPACKIGFDVFSAVFYLVSRYEEYLPHPEDAHGRFMPEKSFAATHGFLEIPVADHYAFVLRNIIIQQYPGVVVPTRKYSFVPTYDIDVAFAYKGRGLLRTAGAALRAIISGPERQLAQRIKVLFNFAPDPYDTYWLQELMHKKYRLKPYYFFLCATPGPFDHNISTRSLAFRRLAQWAGRNGVVGIHPSYQSNCGATLFSAEIKRLSQHLSGEIVCSRQHYLRIHWPTTYRNLIENRILHDFTMGYASRVGFRASTATPFPFYDLLQEKETLLMVHPFAIMDGTLKDYLGLEPIDAIDLVKRIIEQVKLVNGTFISLWHNDSISDSGRWKGWRVVYEQLMESANPEIQNT